MLADQNRPRGRETNPSRRGRGQSAVWSPVGNTSRRDLQEEEEEHQAGEV